MGWTVRSSNPVGGWDFPRLSWPPLGPTQPPLPGIFSGGKTAGAWHSPPTPYSAEVKERRAVALLPSGSSWPLLGNDRLSVINKSKSHTINQVLFFYSTTCFGLSWLVRRQVADSLLRSCTIYTICSLPLSAAGSSKRLTNTRCCRYSVMLLMMGGESTRNM